MEKTRIVNQDQTSFEISVFKLNPKTKTTFMCIPAMGVRATYYEEFADCLCQRGYNVVLTELRGHGTSSVRPTRESDFGYVELLSDLDTVVNYVKEKLESEYLFIIGHSLGGQLGSLYWSLYPDSMKSLILIASCSVYYKGWRNLQALKVYTAGKVFYPLSRIIGYFPGNRLGFAGKEAKTIMKDWCNTVVTGIYKLSNSNLNFENKLKNINGKILSISFVDDRLATRKAVLNLHNKFGNKAEITDWHLSGSTVGIVGLNHFNWAKKPKYFVDRIVKWVSQAI